MIEAARCFAVEGEPIFSRRYGGGHINETYLVLSSEARLYILQKISSHVFQDPVALMRNISLVTSHLKGKAGHPREVLNIIFTLKGEPLMIDGDGSYWRMYEFVSDSFCFDTATSPDILRESAVAFGFFQQRLADFPAKELTETIPRFHDTPNRYRILKKAIQDDAAGRAGKVGAEIDFYLSRESYAGTLMARLEEGALPLRVTHNDTKLNNVLFDRYSKKALCVIDLDTVMPGLSVNDYGDSIRFGATTAAEDEPDLSRVSFSLELFEAYTLGYLYACGKSLATDELDSLCDGAKMMTLECGTRFLTDYLMGDVYFHTNREHQNLDRCRTQMKLVSDMEASWDKMQRIVKAGLNQ